MGRKPHRDRHIRTLRRGRPYLSDRLSSGAAARPSPALAADSPGAGAACGWHPWFSRRDRGGNSGRHRGFVGGPADVQAPASLESQGLLADPVAGRRRPSLVQNSNRGHRSTTRRQLSQIRSAQCRAERRRERWRSTDVVRVPNKGVGHTPNSSNLRMRNFLLRVCCAAPLARAHNDVEPISRITDKSDRGVLA